MTFVTKGGDVGHSIENGVDGTLVESLNLHAMKLKGSLWIFTLLIFAIFTQYDVQAQTFTGTEVWSAVGPRGFSPNWTYYPELEFDSDGMPVVAYIDPTTDRPTVKKYDGTSWTAIGTEGFTTDEVESISFAIGTGGSKYLAMEMNDSIAVLHWDGSQWIPVGGTYASPGGGSEPELIIDGPGTLYLTFVDYFDLNNWGLPRVMTFDGSWSSIGDPGFTDDNPWMIDIATAGGQLYFGSREGYFGSEKIGVYAHGPQGWTLLDDPILHNTHYNFSLAGNASGALFLAYRDREVDSKLTVRQWTGTGWSLLGTAGLGDDYVFQLDMTIGTNGLPVVGVVEGSSEVVRVYEWTGTTWNDISPAPLDNWSSFYASDIDIEIASNGIAHFAVRDDWFTSAVSVFAHQDNIGISEVTELTDIIIWPNPCINEVNISRTNSNEPLKWRLFDATGRTLQSGILACGQMSRRLALPSTLSGVYFFELNSGNTFEVRRLLIVP